MFRAEGFRPLDVIRKAVWNDEEIPFWYRQNILLFVKEDRLAELELGEVLPQTVPPEEYLLLIRRLRQPSVRYALLALCRAVRRRLGTG